MSDGNDLEDLIVNNIILSKYYTDYSYSFKDANNSEISPKTFL